MATHRMPILGWSTVPDQSGNCFFEPYTVLATNQVWRRLIARFHPNNATEPTTRIGLRGGFAVPKNYVGSPVLVVVWTATLTTGNVAWDFDYRAVSGNDAESMDQAGTQGSVTVTDAAPTAAHRRLEATISLNATHFEVDDEVLFELFRDGADAADTMAGSAILFNLLFQYADT